MKFQDGSKKNSRTQSYRAVLIVALVATLIAGFITAPSIIYAQNTTSSTPSNATTAETHPTNTTSTATNATATATPKPVDDYNTPIGHLSAIRHVFDDPALRVQHYCKPNDEILLVCQLYDSTSKNATLIGVEYIITADQYNSLSNREKPNWHLHKVEFAPDRANPMFPELSANQTKVMMGKLMDTYGKVIITWNPRDKLPAFPPQVEQVQHPFMVNSTVKPETNSGSFNQTLKY
jgi:Protein of unknown function (DUF1264)